MENGEIFTDLKLNGKPIKKCELVLECSEKNYRLYVDKDPSSNSFYALAVSFVSSTSIENFWDCDRLMVDQLFNCTAFFDGVRHLEFNRDDEDMAGYMYYPDIQGIIDLLSKVREIELELCHACCG